MKVLLSMWFCHLIDDYVLQGWLASAKQKSWWEKNAPDKMYRNDYKIALIEHAFMNSFAIHIPIYVWLCQNEYLIAVTIFMATYFHAHVDNEKANKKRINLIHDQLAHIIFITLLWAMYYFFH